MIRTILALAISAALVNASFAPAADVLTGFLDKVHKDAGGVEHKYVVFIPHDYKGDREYPVILFLHGSGETKGGKKMPVEVGIGPAIKAREKTFPFITVFPQAEKRPWAADSYDGNLAIAILDDVCKDYKTDKNQTKRWPGTAAASARRCSTASTGCASAGRAAKTSVPNDSPAPRWTRTGIRRRNSSTASGNGWKRTA